MRLFFLLLLSCVVAFADRPNVVLVMADDQGWGQTGYYNHPVLKTPHLDAMAKGGWCSTGFTPVRPCVRRRAPV